MNQKSVYDNGFFNYVNATSGPSATTIAGWVCSLARPKSVLDVGCGQGVWAASFANFGVPEVFGVDGDYVDRSRLHIPSDCYRATDLSNSFSLGQEFDLALCLEVAEHLSPESADYIVSSLTEHAEAVLFSAAIPLQQGTDHRNEQWPEYWIQKFASQGYELHDVVRPQVWNAPTVAVWYRQNTLLFIKPQSDYARTLQDACKPLKSFHGASLVHPEYWVDRNAATEYRVGEMAGPSQRIRGIGAATIRALRSRLT